MSVPKTNLIKTFNNRGITLLANPQQNLELLRVYKNELRRPEVIRPQGCLEDFISPDGFNRPIPRKSYTSSFKQSGALFHKKNTKIALEFFRGLFEPVFKKLNIDISAKFDQNKIYAATYTVNSLHSEEVDNAAVENRLQGYKIRGNKMPDFATTTLYVNTGVYYCDSLEITIAELSTTELEVLNSAEIVKAGIKVTGEQQGYNQIKFDEKVAFGARFAWLEFSMLRNLPIKVHDVTTDEDVTPLGKRNLNQKVRKVLPFAVESEEQ